ncbi:hypothetical protein AAC387_Pa10g1171 [Persea americana]
MAAEGPKSLAFFLLIFNLLLYAIVLAIAGWALNFSIEHTPHKASELTIPVRYFPMYFPMGNMATGFFVVFSLIAGLVGIASSVAGISNIIEWNMSNLLAAATTSFTSWSLTLLAMGFACKEISKGRTEANLRTLEALIIILTGSQLLCVLAIYSGIGTVRASPTRPGRV